MANLFYNRLIDTLLDNKYKVEPLVEPIIDYIENIYGHDNFIEIFTRLNLLEPYSQNNHLKSLIKDSKEIHFDSPELIEKWGVHSFDLVYDFNKDSVLDLYLELHTDYRYIDVLFQSKQLKTNENNDLGYMIHIDKIKIDEKVDLSNFQKLYYIIDSHYTYDIDFKYREVVIIDGGYRKEIRQGKSVSLKMYQYFNLLNHNARYSNEIKILSSSDILNKTIYNLFDLDKSLGESKLFIHLNPNDFYENKDNLNNNVYHHYPNESLQLFNYKIGGNKKFNDMDDFVNYLSNIRMNRKNIFVVIESAPLELKKKCNKVLNSKMWKEHLSFIN